MKREGWKRPVGRPAKLKSISFDLSLLFDLLEIVVNSSGSPRFFPAPCNFTGARPRNVHFRETRFARKPSNRGITRATREKESLIRAETRFSWCCRWDRWLLVISFSRGQRSCEIKTFFSSSWPCIRSEHAFSVSCHGFRVITVIGEGSRCFKVPGQLWIMVGD